MLATEFKTSSYPVNKNNIARLVSLAKEKSHRMPSGLTREERKRWAAEIRIQAQ